jgi:hypothetical protein
MGIFKERVEVTPDLEHRTEEIAPLTIERKEVVTPATTVFQAQVKDEAGSPLIETPENKEITVEIPYDGATLQVRSQGSIDDSVTWFGAHWLRILKKALSFKWRVVTRKVT